MNDIAGYVALITLSVLAVFQLALICGASLGRFAWGGQHAVLPTRLRLASVGSIVLYVAFCGIIADATGRINTSVDNSVVYVCMWVLTIYFALGVLLNGISRSRSERVVMTPAALLLALCCFVIVLGI